MKNTIKTVVVIIPTAIAYVSFLNDFKLINMENLRAIIMAALVCGLMIYLVYQETQREKQKATLNKKLQKFNHAVNIQLFTHLSVIRDLFIMHPDIADEYIRDIEGMTRLNPIKAETLDDLFIFNEDDNYKELIKSLSEEINKKDKTIA